jgi:hypothetical protein
MYGKQATRAGADASAVHATSASLPQLAGVCSPHLAPPYPCATLLTQW